MERILKVYWGSVTNLLMNCLRVELIENAIHHDLMTI